MNWTRLWDLKHLQNIAVKNEEAKNIKAIVIDGGEFLETAITNLPSLRYLDLSDSESLTETPNLTGVPRLRKLVLEGCIKLRRIHRSIGILRELVYLNLRNCKKNFLNLNIIFRLNSLESVDLSGCSKLLDNGSAIQLSTSSVYKLLTLTKIEVHCTRKREDSLHFSRLRRLDLSFCNLFQIPDAIGSLQSLVSLNLEGNKFLRLSAAIKEFSNLCILNLNHCKQLKYFPELPTIKERSSRYHERLYVLNCPNLSEIEDCYHKALWQPFLAEIDIVVPGTQIPRWFSKQNVGNSITMDLSSVMDDPCWMGVACCALLAAHGDPTNLIADRFIPYSFEFILLPRVYRILYRIDSTLLTYDLVSGEMDHLFILLLSREQIFSNGNLYEDEVYDRVKMGFTAEKYG
ncbi:hypothetical protein Fmac_021440 [Flemingia macrophylla]|uniref:C-JID domain-containing protein n=1 Tax=Flemingia macrophylla TaxID=520843 RepID=A0ABD1LWW4_9FABA